MQKYHRDMNKATPAASEKRFGLQLNGALRGRSIRLMLSAVSLIATMVVSPLLVLAQDAPNAVYLPFTSEGGDPVAVGETEFGPFDFDTETVPALPTDFEGASDGVTDADGLVALAPNIGCIGWPTTRRGDRGQWTYWAQYFLKNYHNQNIALDGSFGPATENAVRYVQQYWRNRGYTACGRAIAVDGIIGSQGWALLYYRRTPPPASSFVDRDRDGLDDNYENRLLQKFAPRIWLHGSEEHFPSTPEWFMTNSRMNFNHNNCNDHEIIARGSVNANNIAIQSHEDTNSFCRHDSNNIHHSSWSSYFFLDLENSKQSTRLHRSQWKLYGHVYKRSNGQIMVQYWQFYAYNKSGASSVRINHEGDWEFTAVSINANEQVQKVIFSQHEHTHERNVNEVSWVGNHHVTYSAKGSHAQYKNIKSGTFDGCNDTGWQSRLDTCHAGTAWDSWGSGFGGIVNIGEKNHPLNNSGWLKFAGKWGEIGHSKHTTGPAGPAQQGNWLR